MLSQQDSREEMRNIYSPNLDQQKIFKLTLCVIVKLIVSLSVKGS